MPAEQLPGALMSLFYFIFFKYCESLYSIHLLEQLPGEHRFCRASARAGKPRPFLRWEFSLLVVIKDPSIRFPKKSWGQCMETSCSYRYQSLGLPGAHPLCSQMFDAHQDCGQPQGLFSPVPLHVSQFSHGFPPDFS